ncbi:hypothetical protein [Chlamydia gallinacea]|uniref:hypothetical protein n=1 Tax=Chlamydia gallinacea TaxID=1457153 RepID=UPI0024E1FE89|nr:hypothetical protein [Chlamydia gallinacea]
MVAPHPFGFFSGRPNKNVFTLQDIDKSSSSTSRKVSRAQPSAPQVLEKKRASSLLVMGIFLSLSCLIHSVSLALVLGAGCVLAPVIIAVVLQTLMILSIMICLAWTAYKAFITNQK